MERFDKFSSCDCSDSLAALGDIKLLGHIPKVVLQTASKAKIVGPAYTVEFVLSSDKDAPKATVNHVDTAPKGSIIVMKAPSKAPNAVWGGLMTARALAVGVQGVVIEGNYRDHSEIVEMNFPVWASGKSTMGAAPICRPSTVGEDLTLAHDSLCPVLIKTGDIIIADEDGVVRIPAHLIDRVYEECVKRTAIDEKCMVAIKSGSTIVDAFAKYR